MKLSDARWEMMREHFWEENILEGREGRNPVPARAVLEAMLWILNTGHSGICCLSVIRTIRRFIVDFSGGAEVACSALF
jgi:hypothetical protein